MQSVTMGGSCVEKMVEKSSHVLFFWWNMVMVMMRRWRGTRRVWEVMLAIRAWRGYFKVGWKEVICEKFPVKLFAPTKCVMCMCVGENARAVLEMYAHVCVGHLVGHFREEPQQTVYKSMEEVQRSPHMIYSNGHFQHITNCHHKFPNLTFSSRSKFYNSENSPTTTTTCYLSHYYFTFSVCCCCLAWPHSKGPSSTSLRTCITISIY